MQDSASYSADLSLDLPTPEAMKPATPTVVPVVAVPLAQPSLDNDKCMRLIPGLTYREADVVVKVCAGHSNKEVGAKLFVTEKTVKFHLTNIYKKAAVVSRAQLIVKMTGKN